MSVLLLKLFLWAFQQSQTNNSGETWGKKKDIKTIMNDEN